MRAGEPEAPPQRTYRDSQAGVTRRQFLISGGHNDAYWRRVAPAEVDFVGRVFGGASPGA
ncbi:MAG TPA: hypothetical protein VFH93_02755 [Thermoleophilia bacterium]|nr:hypothetical protein [Thermoleophilia bacterium]